MLVECVPNLSEGRDPERIARLVAAVERPGVALLDRHSDPDHNRTVLTLAGHPEPLLEAVLSLAECALREIDLREHAGCHPRIGALDVVPFVPLEGASMQDCVELARRAGERLASELELPIYLYAQAATRPERARLPWLRRPGFEGLADALASDERAPDFGPPRPHPSGGATAVGARDVLVAFNVDLEGGDLALARAIARELRTSNGGLPGVQARGMQLADQGRVQVSMNLFDLAQTGVGDAYAAVAKAARAAGADVGRAERVGLVPRAAVGRGLAVWLGEPIHEGVLEDRIESSGLVLPSGGFARTLRQLAGHGAGDPGGGTAAALALALARATLDKVVAFSRGPKCDLSDEELDALVASVPSLEALLDLGEADQRAFAAVLAAWGLPRGPERKQAIAAARGPAVRVPEEQLAAAREIAAAAATLAEVGNPNLVNDAAAACELALAAGQIAALNAHANQRKRDRQDYAPRLRQLEGWARQARQAALG